MKKVLDVLVRLYATVRALLKQYPAASAALLNIAVAVCAFFGLAITGPQLVIVIGAVTAVLGALVHQNVTPVAKLNPPVKE